MLGAAARWLRPRRGLGLLRALLAAAGAGALEFPHMHMPKMPKMPGISSVEFPFHPLDGDTLESECAQNAPKYSSGWPASLDWGIYWFGPDDQFSKVPTDDQPARFYDRTKRTMLFVHGWTGDRGGWTKACKRQTTRCAGDVCPDGGGQLMLQQWIASGWNVGIFYWDQFADEQCTRDAEQKIWFDRGGDGFRWKSLNSTNQVGSHEYKGDDVVSVTDLCVSAVKHAMSDYEGAEVRFVGHSIGSQLAVRCAAELHEAEHPAAPKRLALLEPRFTQHNLGMFRCTKIDTHEGIGTYTALSTASYVKNMWKEHDVATEVYKSSLYTEEKAFGDPNEALAGISTVVLYEPTWCGGLANFGLLQNARIGHLQCRHDAVVPAYFLGYGLPAKQVAGVPLNSGAPTTSALGSCPVPTATCSTGQLREWIDRQVQVQGSQVWAQTAGQETFDLNDDLFSMTPPLGQQVPLYADIAQPVEEEKPPPKPWWYLGLSKYAMLAIGAALVACIGCAMFVCLLTKLLSPADSDSDSDSDSESDEENGHEMARKMRLRRGE